MYLKSTSTYENEHWKKSQSSGLGDNDVDVGCRFSMEYLRNSPQILLGGHVVIVYYYVREREKNNGVFYCVFLFCLHRM